MSLSIGNAVQPSHSSRSVKVEGNVIVCRRYVNGTLVCVSRFAATVENLRIMGLS